MTGRGGGRRRQRQQGQEPHPAFSPVIPAEISGPSGHAGHETALRCLHARPGLHPAPFLRKDPSRRAFYEHLGADPETVIRGNIVSLV